MEPLIRIPQEDAPPMPPKKLKGMEITNAQGQLITRKVSALVIHTDQAAGLFHISIFTRGGKIARATAP